MYVNNTYLTIFKVGLFIIALCAVICVFIRPRLMLGLFLLWLGCWTIYWGNPYKYALREEQFNKYNNYILIREVHYTGTGWTMIGDETGYFSESEIEEIWITGEKLPMASRALETDDYNIFLCIVESKGRILSPARTEVEHFEILDWYPVFPVRRTYRILPQFFFPRRYMTLKDIDCY